MDNFYLSFITNVFIRMILITSDHSFWMIFVRWFHSTLSREPKRITTQQRSLRSLRIRLHRIDSKKKKFQSKQFFLKLCEFYRFIDSLSSRFWIIFRVSVGENQNRLQNNKIGREKQKIMAIIEEKKIFRKKKREIRIVSGFC